MAEVQNRVDSAAQWIKQNYVGLSPQQFGTAVHYNVQQQIRSLNDPNFRSEVSFLKGEVEGYGTPGSIRINVFEKISPTVLCVYDIKTGRSGLSQARKAEIANAAFKGYGQNFPVIVVTEIRPTR